MAFFAAKIILTILVIGLTLVGFNIFKSLKEDVAKEKRDEELKNWKDI